MYNCIGKKIKLISKIIFIIEMLISIIGGFSSLFYGISEDESEFIIVGIIGVVAGQIIAWLSTILLYGFGELIAKTTEISENTAFIISQDHTYISDKDVKMHQQRVNELNRIYKLGYISTEEYNEKMEEIMHGTK